MSALTLCPARPVASGLRAAVGWSRDRQFPYPHPRAAMPNRPQSQAQPVPEDLADLAEHDAIKPEELPALRRIYDRAEPKVPERKTNARPGSPAKRAILALRLRRGEQLFHPDDLTIAQLSEDIECEPSIVATRDDGTHRRTLRNGSLDCKDRKPARADRDAPPTPPRAA